MKYNISVATKSDIQAIMDFIKKYWGENHILAIDSDIFSFQYQNQLDKNLVNFIVAKDVEGTIKAILGFIPSELTSSSPDIFAALWKVADDVKSPMLGLKLLNYLRRKFDSSLFSTLGLNETSSSIYRLMKFNVDTLAHFVLLNPTIDDYKIAKVTKGLNQPESLDARFSVKYVTDTEVLNTFDFPENIRPKKDLDYLHYRYFNHPVYTYEILGIYEGDSLLSFWIGREQKMNGRVCLRLVDYFGPDNHIAQCGSSLNDFLIEQNYEYIDFMCIGIDKVHLIKAGFEMLDHEDNRLIVPDYFSPYVQKNVPMMYAVDSENMDNVRLFKGDGDQDRPN